MIGVGHFLSDPLKTAPGWLGCGKRLCANSSRYTVEHKETHYYVLMIIQTDR